MGRLATIPLVAAGIIAVSACANFNTIDRTTRLPTNQDTYGKAVHLDIQQRLLIVNEFGHYCSEPSPDALAAFAAAFGLGASSPAQGALSVAGSGQSSAASIGLRTQSITLMRDALFRMCEAYANGAVGSAQIAALLSRSQDLTAVILAVEQLTGAVVANQAALTGGTAADASAVSLATTDMLEAAIANEERAQTRLDQAQERLNEAKAERDGAVTALETAQTSRNNLDDTATVQQRQDADRDVAFRQAERDRAQRAVDNAQGRLELRQRALESAENSREAIEANQDSASTSAAASTTSAAQFSTPRQVINLNKEATEAIAGAVESIVTEVLRKEYAVESCMAVITAPPKQDISMTPAEKQQLARTQQFCFELVQASVKARTEAILTTNFGADQTSDRIDAWIQLPGNRERLQAWLNAKTPRIRVFALLQGDFRALRDEAIVHFNIP